VGESMITFRGALLLLWFLPSLPIAFVRPFYGILMWMIFAFINPQWYTWGSGYLLPWSQLVAIATLAGTLIFTDFWRRMASRENLMLLILWCWFTVTSIVSSNTPLFAPNAEDTWFHWNFVSKILLMTVVTAAVVDSFAKLRTLVLLI